MDKSAHTTAPHESRAMSPKVYRLLVSKAREDIAAATSLDEMAAALDTLASYGDHIRLSGLTRGVWLTVGLFCLASGFVLAQEFPYDLWWIPYTLKWGAGLMVASLLLLAARERSSGRKLDKLIADTYLRLCTGSRYLEVGSGDRLAADLRKKFVDFDRGNHRRNIVWMLEMPVMLRGHRIRALPYQLHYVDKKTRTTTDFDGKPKTEYYYEHHDRYGVIFDLPRGPEVSILREGRASGQRYRPESSEFNRIFKVHHRGDPIAAARFLTPSVQLLLIRLAASFERMNIERIENQLCVSFNDSNLLQLPFVQNHRSPRALQAQLRAGPRPPPRLQALLAEIDEFVRLTQHDRNAAWPDIDASADRAGNRQRGGTRTATRTL